MQGKNRIVVVMLMLMLVGCGGASSTAPTQPAESQSVSSADVVAAFKRAGLPAENPARIPPNQFGIAPVLTSDATRFLIPSLGEDAGGRAFVLDSPEDLAKMKAAYDAVGRESGLLFSWTFVNEDRLVLVQINGDLPEVEAKKYGGVVAAL